MDTTDRRKSPRSYKASSTMSAALWLLGIGLMIHSAAAFYYVLMPMSHWIDYKGVEPVKPTFVVNEELLFVSSFSTKRDCAVKFIDTLICDINDDLYGYKRHASSIEKVYQLSEQTVEDSVFPLPVTVDKTANCYLRTTVVLELPLNIDRYKKVKSESFDIIDPGE